MKTLPSKPSNLPRRLVFNRNDDGSVNSVTVHGTSKLEKIAPVVATKV